MGRKGLAIGGVALIGIGVAVATGVMLPSKAEANAQLTEPIETVAVDNDSGNVTIRAGNVTTTTVRQHFEYRWNRPDNAFTVDGTTLALSGCGWGCDVDYEVVVPRGTNVDGEINSGDLHLEGVNDIRVSANSGRIRAAGITGRVVEVDVDSGNIDVGLDRPASVRLDADSGNIDLTVPPGQYQVVGDTDSGNREVQIASVPGSGNVLDLTTDSGNVMVSGA